MAAELLARITPKPYAKYVSSINERDAITIDAFRTSNWANYFRIDANNTVRNGKVNPNHVFELFGSFNGKTGYEVRTMLLQNIADNIEFYDKHSVVCLQMRAIGFDTWVESLSNERVFCDELCLTGLSFMYGRHTLVLTKNRMWSTVEMSEPVGLLDLLKICSVRLVYLGQLRFGLLHWDPRPPRPVPKPKTASFKIIEEYTIDEPSPPTTSASVPVETHSVNVQNLPALSSVRNTLPSTSLDAQNTEVPVKEHVETTKTSRDYEPHNTESTPVCDLLTCAEDGLVLSSYPWKKDLQVAVDRLTPVEIDIWCGNTSEYYRHVPDPDPVVSAELQSATSHGYGLRKTRSVKTEVKVEPDQNEQADDEPAKLLQYADSLIKDMKSIASKPTKKRQLAEKPKKKSKRQKSSLPVETTAALDKLHNSTIDQLTPIGKPSLNEGSKQRTV